MRKINKADDNGDNGNDDNDNKYNDHQIFDEICFDLKSKTLVCINNRSLFERKKREKKI